jgi:hypothetical protein
MHRRGSTMRLSALLSITLCMPAVLLPVASARADIVLHDGGVNKDRDASRRVEERTGTAPSLVLSSDVLAGPTRVLTANATIEQCEGAPINLDVAAKLNKIEEAVLSYELEIANRSLDILSTLLPCADSPVPAGALARMSFLRGATLLDMGDPLAEKAMAEALAFLPDYTGERGFPRAHKEMLDTARRRMATLPDGRLFIWAGPGGEGVFVDGTTLYQEHSVGSAVRPGLHLVQVIKDGVMKGMWVRIRSRFSALIFPGAGRGIWADGGRSPGGEQAMALLLAAEFRGQQGDIHILHYRGRLISGSTWPALGAIQRRWKSTTGISKRRGDRRRPARSRKGSTETVAAKGPPEATDQASATAATKEATAATKEATAATKEATAANRNSATTKAEAASSQGPPKAMQADPTAAEAKVEPKIEPASPTSGSGKLSGKRLAPHKSKPYEQRRFRVALGGGYHYADPFNYAVLAVDVSYQFFGPLHAALFLRPSLGAIAKFPVAEGEEPIIGPLSFVPVGLGIGVQKPGRLAPYARIVGQYAYNRDRGTVDIDRAEIEYEAEHLGGVMIQGGLDLTPKEGLPIIIRVQGEAGFLGAHFNARLWAGIGLNI